VPAQHHLCGGFAMGHGDAGDNRVLQRALLRIAAVNGDPADWRPGLGQGAMRGVDFTSGLLREVRVQFDLVHGRHDLDAVKQRLQVLWLEVAHADRSDLAVALQRLKRLLSLDGQLEGVGKRLVKDEQVYVVDAELGGALVERVQGLVISVVTDPDLGLDEDLGAD
jgi:hypothetical protein